MDKVEIILKCDKFRGTAEILKELGFRVKTATITPEDLGDNFGEVDNEIEDFNQLIASLAKGKLELITEIPEFNVIFDGETEQGTKLNLVGNSLSIAKYKSPQDKKNIEGVANKYNLRLFVNYD